MARRKRKISLPSDALPPQLATANLHAAGIDVGAEDFLPFVNPDLSHFHPICTTGSRRLRVAS